MIMGGGEEFECITETSALQTKKNYQGDLNDTPNIDYFFCLSSKTRSTHSIIPNIYYSHQKRKKERQCTEGNLGTQDCPIVSGELEINASQNCFHKVIKIRLKLK